MGHARKKLDLTGRRLDKPAVLVPAGNVDARTAWLRRYKYGRLGGCARFEGAVKVRERDEEALRGEFLRKFAEDRERGVLERRGSAS